jgi:hypothetical protein
MPIRTDEPLRALEDVLLVHLHEPFTKMLATQIVEDVLNWANKYGIEVKK